MIADLDGDDANELVLGSSEVIHVYESTADDVFTHVWSSDWPIPGNVMDLCLGPAGPQGFPAVAACSFDGQVDLFGFDGDGYARLLDPPLAIDEVLRSVDHGLYDGDLRDDLVLAVAGLDQAAVYEGEAATAAPALPGAGSGPHLAVEGNPYRPGGAIRYAAGSAGGDFRLELYDASGRLVRRLAAGAAASGEGRARWDGCDAAGRPAASGVYLLRLRAAGTQRSLRLVFLQGG